MFRSIAVGAHISKPTEVNKRKVVHMSDDRCTVTSGLYAMICALREELQIRIRPQVAPAAAASGERSRLPQSHTICTQLGLWGAQH